MAQKIIAGILLLVAGIALLCVGVSFAAEALYQALLPYVGPAGAPALVAVLFLAIPPLAVLLSGKGRKPAKPENTTREPLLAFLAAIAKQKPVIAVLVSALVGVASFLLRKKNPE